MSFLAPLYLAGLAVLSLPVVLHLIRRTPQGRRPFSSLIFLRESPPRITRRSRIDHWLLLALRALIAALLVLAFTRPFLRQISENASSSQYARRIAVLLDTSASMRRGDLWRRARQATRNILQEVGPSDEVAVFAFDEQLRTILDFPDRGSALPRQPLRAAEEALAALQPTWNATALGQALATTADLLVERNDRHQSRAALQLFVVSDLQHGSDLSSLQSYSWPPQVTLELVPVALDDGGNAGIQAIAERATDHAADQLRVLVSNDAEATRERFRVGWRRADGSSLGQTTEAYVPAGQSRVLRVRRPSDSSDAHLELLGDAHAFDNRAYFVPVQRQTARVVYVGTDHRGDPQGLAYYLESALGNAGHWQSSLEVVANTRELPAQLTGAALAVVSASLDAPAARTLRSYASQGGIVLVALPAQPPVNALRMLLGDDELQVTEASLGDYTMLAGIDFAHPLFAPFVEPQYSDFTKVRFWKARDVSWSSQNDLQTLARFDNELPALVQQQLGDGAIYLIASTWVPADSQLALSSKFVPFIAGLLAQAGVGHTPEIQLEVGQSFPLPLAEQQRSTSTVTAPDGTQYPLDATAVDFASTQLPGIYRWQSGQHEQAFAVNVAAAESRTSSLDGTQLEQYGVRLGRQPDQQSAAQRRRQMLDQELEGRQRIWHWMIACALILMVAETGLAGWLGRRRPPSGPLRSAGTKE